MTLFFEIFPVFLFFIAFKFYGIYIATVVGIVTTLLQVIISKVFFKKWDKKQLVTLAVFMIFGGLTLYFHNPIFVKWKPTVVFWVFAMVIIGSQLFTHKPMMQRLMENILEENAIVSLGTWKRLNIIWAMFFVTLGGINLYVAYSFSNEAWVNFKFYGVTSALFLFSLFQAFYLMYFMAENKVQK